MKRYRVLSLQFDLSPNELMSFEAVEKSNQSQDLKQRINEIKEILAMRYGQVDLEKKIDNLRQLDFKKLSIVAHIYMAFKRGFRLL